MLTKFCCQRQYLVERRAIPQSSFARPLDHRPIGHRIAERHAQFDDVRAGINRGEHDIASRRQVWIAAGHVSDQRGLVVESQRHGN